MDIVVFFPRTPMPVRIALTELQTTAQPVPGETPDATKQRLLRLEELPRPWIPGSCPPELRVRVYRWLDRIAEWLNDQYSWQSKTMIPACWPRHPHIAHELAVLAIQRYLAERDINPTALDDWHRYNRPLFVDRMLTQLSEGCRSAHTTWPGRSRFNEYRDGTAERAELFDGDVADD